MRARLLVLILVLTTLAGSASAFVLPVTDVANWLRNQAIRAQTYLHLGLQDQQRLLITKMARRLSAVIGSLQARYGIRDPDPPRWRIHDFESEAFPHARAYLAALNYGDAGGQAYRTIARPVASLAALPPDTPVAIRQALAHARATIDIADALMTTGAHQAGQIRFNGRQLDRATTDLAATALDADETQSTTAVLDTLNAAAVLELKQQQARVQLLVTAVELAVLDNVRHRNAEVIAMNQRLRAEAHFRTYAATIWPDAEDARAAAWRQP